MHFNKPQSGPRAKAAFRARGRQKNLKHRVRIKVNGRDFDREVDSRLLLVDFIRDKLGLTGTHIGCIDGKCGACTLLVSDIAVKSCTLFAVQIDGTEILTIEGLSAPDGELHPIQKAFQDNHALQCGYCTPGMVMSAYELIRRFPVLSEKEIREGMTGNLCRCTGYVGIVRAIKQASSMMIRS